MKLRVVKPSTPAEKRAKSTVELVEVTPKLASSWKRPAFQREFILNAKCQALIEEFRHGGVFPGTLTLGVLDGDTYLVDGQHRVCCFLASDAPSAPADVRTVFCDSMAAMAEEFVELNGRLVNMRPDDVLRGLEACYEPLRRVREQCPFVGYGKRGKGEKSAIVSMSLVLRSWRAGQVEVPSTTGGSSAATLGASLTHDDAATMAVFLTTCFEAWERHPQYARLWGSLNLTICAWLFNRTVLSQYSPKTPRLSREQFRRCLMGLSADSNYLDWLVGRSLGEHDRAPAYDRIKRVFADRLTDELGKRPAMPAPAWA